MITDVLINGEPSDGRIPVTDSSVLRGDGVFEVLKAYNSEAFGLDFHLDRLEASARAMHLDLPPRIELAAWIEQVSSQLGGGVVRVIVTRGSSIPGLDDPANVIVFGHSWDREFGPARLYPVAAPWHAAGVVWDLAGAKITSYAPNLSATRRAKAEGFEDALLTTVDGVMLEGPTFSVAWVVDGVVETPGLHLGILDSITRKVVVSGARETGIEVIEDVWTLERLRSADEVMALSTIREVQPVVAVGDLEFEPGTTTEKLAGVFSALVG
ncbi:MAG TPA: aminotransferase class IV [Acidimicrobiia bacterium]|nr:aminotransferase class IV [Acidimicrobiia bacterium]